MDVHLSVPQGQAMVLYEALARYHASGRKEFVPDAAEWRALILLLGELERQLSGAVSVEEWQRAVVAARQELGAYDGGPFSGGP